MPEVKAGETTSERAVAKSGSAWGIIGMVLGLLVSAGSAIGAAFGAGTMAGIIVGGVVAIVAIAQKMFTDLGYLKSRTDVKTAASLSGEKPAEE